MTVKNICKSCFSSKFSKIVSSLTLVLLSGCAGVMPDAIVSMGKVNPIELKNEYIFLTDFPGGARFQHSIAPGAYIAVGKDSGGIYYKGPKSCLITTMLIAGWALRDEGVNKISEIADCGIYIPTAIEKSALVYAVIGSGLSQADLIKINQDQNAVKNGILINNVIQNPGMTPIQAGVGGAVAGAVVGLLVDAENGRFNFLRNQQPSQKLRQALIMPSSSAETIAPAKLPQARN